MRPEDGLFGEDQLQFSWWFGPALTLPGQEGRRQRENRKETRGERDRLAENGGSPHPAKEEPPPFLARRLPFCPGRGLICHRENPRSSESIENRSFSERILLFFSNKTSELFYFTPHPPLPEGVKKLISFFFTSFRRKPESSVFKTLALTGPRFSPG